MMNVLAILGEFCTEVDRGQLFDQFLTFIAVFDFDSKRAFFECFSKDDL
jgi:hypothetical protein